MISYLLYLLVTTSCVFANLIKQFNNGKLKPILNVVLISLIGFFLCLGYMTGSDWPQYELAYYSDFYIFKEFGLTIVYYLAKIANLSFWPVFIALKLFCFISFIYTLKNLTPRFWLAFAFLIPRMCLFLFIDNPMRNLIAASLFWLAIIFYIQKRTKMFIIAMCVAISFHYSTLCVLPFLFLFLIRDKIIRHPKLSLFLLTLVIILLSNQTLLFNIFTSFLSFLGSRRGISYFNEESKYGVGRLFSLGLMLYIIQFLLIFRNRHKIIISNKEQGINLIILCAIHLILMRLSYTIKILGRLTFFTEPFFVCTVINCFRFYKKKYKIYFFFISLTSLLALYMTFNAINAPFYNQEVSINVYIPYSNYVEEILLQQNKSISIRRSYNLKRNISSIF